MADGKVRIFDIERFAIKDGPGIRTVVFMSGCPLHCPWCSNPESGSQSARLMHVRNRCLRCGACAGVCSKGAVSAAGDGLPSFDRKACDVCGACKDICPGGAIRIVPREEDCRSIIDIILRDKDYYDNSGGGVTFSGGEAMLQRDALLQMLKSCREQGVGTALETCGNVPQETVRAVMPYVDLFLFDLKHIDPLQMREVTGGDMGLILSNLEMIASSASAKIRLRIPCIPGFNFEKSFFEDVFRLAKRLGTCGIDLLPYHELGRGKYDQLGLEYGFHGGSADIGLIREFASEGIAMGLDIKVF